MSDPIDELLPFYALGTLNQEERGQVEEYLRRNPDAKKRLDDYTAAVSALPLALTPVNPGDQVKQGLLAQIQTGVQSGETAPQRQERAESAKPGRSSLRWGLAIPLGLSLAIAALALFWVALLNSEVSRQRTLLAELNSQLQNQGEAIAQVDDFLASLEPSRVQIFTINGTEFQPDAQAQLIADPNERSAVLVVSGLEPLTEGETYQVWLISGETPASAGLLEVNQRGSGVLILSSAQEINAIDALGVSVEPPGGSPQPTGDIVILSELS